MLDICRVIARLCALGFAILVSAADYGLNVFSRRGEVAIRSRLAWVGRTARRFLWVLNVRVESTGMPPRRGLLVSNHLGYLDIIVFNSISPMIFVSKVEVRGWPVFGWLASCAGTLFVDRTRRLDVERVSGGMADILNTGVVVALFPEGTSSGGRDVLPFRSSLLEPAASRGWPVTPACVSYHVPGGSAENDVCYWGAMSFLPHLLKLLSKKTVHASVAYGAPVEADRDRKQLASRLHGEVTRLRQPAGCESTMALSNATGEALEDLAR